MACDSNVSVLLGHTVVTDVGELHIERAGTTDQDSAAIERTNDSRLFALAGDTVCVKPFVGLRSEGIALVDGAGCEVNTCSRAVASRITWALSTVW